MALLTFKPSLDSGQTTVLAEGPADLAPVTGHMAVPASLGTVPIPPTPPPPPPPPPATTVPTSTVVPGGSVPTTMPVATGGNQMSVGFTNVPGTQLPTGGGSTMPTIPDVFGIPGSGGVIQTLGTQAIQALTGGGSETPTQETPVPGECPGAGSIMVAGVGCVNIGDLFPGGNPAITDPVSAGMADTMAHQGELARGRYGVGVVPTVQARATRKCPPKMKLGDDGLCYRNLLRSQRRWDPGMKPLMTGGDRAAIRRAAKVAGALDRETKRLKKASRALAKVC